MAWGTPTTIGTNLSTTTGAQTGNITSVTASIGDLVIVSGSVNRGGTATVSISDSASNTWSTVVQDFHAGSGTHGFLAGAYITNALSGGTITVSISGGINWTSATAGASKVTGAASSSTNDTAANQNTNAAATTTPTITSGTPANAGDIFFTTYANVGATTDSYTEDTTNGTWSTLYSKSGTATSTFAQSYQVNAGSGTMKHQPTTTSRGYVQAIMAFKVAASTTNYSASGAPGSLVLTGVNATVAHAKSIAGAPGSLTLTGVNATVAHARSIAGSPGSLVLTGVNANLARTVVASLSGAPGALTLTGVNAALTYQPFVAATSGTGGGGHVKRLPYGWWADPEYVPSLKKKTPLKEIEKEIVREAIEEVREKSGGMAATLLANLVEPYTTNESIDWQAINRVGQEIQALRQAIAAYRKEQQEEAEDEEAILLLAH